MQFQSTSFLKLNKKKKSFLLLITIVIIFLRHECTLASPINNENLENRAMRFNAQNLKRKVLRSLFETEKVNMLIFSIEDLIELHRAVLHKPPAIKL